MQALLTCSFPFNIAIVGTCPCICRCIRSTIVGAHLPHILLSGVVYKPWLCWFPPCDPRDALTYGWRALPVSMTKVSRVSFVPSGQGPTGLTFRALRCMAIGGLTSSDALSWSRRDRIFEKVTNSKVLNVQNKNIVHTIFNYKLLSPDTARKTKQKHLY